ncbi:MAG TPA: Ig-like domain-containing protein [Rhodothermales bacterium]|nr:Ig-like domain-containing protein [Rhodothermales bacterium]
MLIRAFTLGISICLLHGIGFAQAPDVVLRTGPISAGGGTSQGEGLALQSTLGQPVQGRTAATGLVAGSGFWPGARPVGPVAIVAPVAVADAVVTDEDTPVEIDMLANDVDPGGGVLVLVEVGVPSNGRVDSIGPSSVVYTPDVDYFGQDSFGYVIENTQGGTARGVVNVTIRPVNDPPVFVSEPVLGAAAGDLYSYTVVVTDVDGEVPTITAVELPSWLAFPDHGDGTGTLTGTPTNAEVGEHEVTLEADDGVVAVEQSFTITVILGAPITPELIAPADGSVVGEVQVRLEWNPVPGAATYDVQLATMEDFNQVLLEETGLSASQREVSDLEAGATYFWRVRAVNGAGLSGYASPFHFTLAANVAVEDGADVPDRFALLPNYPNPFNPQTTIPYELPRAAAVELIVYDLYGRVVERLVDGRRPAGRHTVVFDARAVPSGVYIYRLQAEDWSQARRLVLVK